MFNRLSETRFFNKANQVFNFEKNLSSVNLSYYKVPYELYKDRIELFKGYKLPLAKEVYDYVKNGKIVPVLFSEPVNPSKKLPNLHIDSKFPNSIFNMISIGSDGNPCILVDLSYLGKYDKDTVGNPIYLNIAEIQLFYMCLAGYINLRLVEDENITKRSDFYFTIADTYSLILSKIIDNMFPIASSSNTDNNKLYFLCSCFCLETMFKLPKETAINFALKTTGIDDKNGILNESVYVNSPELSMSRVDYKTEFPIDRFCDIVCKEYRFIDSKKFNPSTLMLKFSDRLTKNAWFALEHLGSFITMIVLSKGALGIFNDIMIKRYLDIRNKDPLKQMATYL